MTFFKNNMLAVFLIALLGIFGLQTYLGEHGLKAGSALKARISGLNKKLHILQDRRGVLERKTKLLAPGAIDPDLLENQARELLNFVYENERVFVQKNR